MNKQTRIDKINQIKESMETPIGKMEIPWKGSLEPMNVYKIPLEYLIYNKYNGRILSRTKSLENQHKKIDVETEEGKKSIEKLLWDSKEDRNKKTLDSIKTSGGQQKPGIITLDGVIIDGNRRAMLLRRSGMYDYFKAVILPVKSDENPYEVEKLETSFQMGEDEKLGYNPIEKYLKTKGLYQMLSGKNYNPKFIDNEAIRKISDWMGEEKSTVKEYLEVMGTMDDYLDYLDYQGIYTQLDNREDQFIQLTRWLNTFYGEQSGKAFDGYKDTDVDDLKIISFDYIRIKYEGKKFRYLAYGLKENHFFGIKDIWESFKNFHFSRRQLIIEEKANLNSQNLERHLNDRDDRFYQLSKNEEGESFLEENVDNHYQRLRYTQAAGQPEKLLKNAKRALESINQRHKTFSSPEVAKELGSLSDFISKMLSKSSPEKLLSHIIDLLNGLDLSKSNYDADVLFEKAKEIQRIAYQFTKEIKKK